MYLLCEYIEPRLTIIFITLQHVSKRFKNYIQLDPLTLIEMKLNKILMKVDSSVRITLKYMVSKGNIINCEINLIGDNENYEGHYIGKIKNDMPFGKWREKTSDSYILFEKGETSEINTYASWCF